MSLAPSRRLVGARPMIDGVPIHEYASLFPPMTDEEFDALVEDIREHGQVMPVLMYDGAILDGVNRSRACRKLGIKPVTVEWKGKGSPLNFVISMNMQRRHLTQPQRALLAAKALPMFQAEAEERQKATRFADGGGKNTTTVESDPGKARDQAGKAFGVSGKYVSQAAKLLTESPNLATQVFRKELSLADAVSQLPKPKGPVVGPKPRDPIRTHPQQYNNVELWDMATEELADVRDSFNKLKQRGEDVSAVIAALADAKAANEAAKRRKK